MKVYLKKVQMYKQLQQLSSPETFVAYILGSLVIKGFTNGKSESLLREKKM